MPAAPLPPIRVGTVDEVEDDSAVLVDGAANGTGEDIAVFRSGGRFYALNDVCTHEFASLADGWIEDGVVECPLHGAQFSLCTGKVRALPATQPEPTHRIELRGDEVWLHPGVPSDCVEDD